ncbi:MAG: YdcF family protein [Rubrobacteraceae bacterium]|nr:YdcF family protein [Rubrobacteraceae bacterium]
MRALFQSLGDLIKLLEAYRNGPPSSPDGAEVAVVLGAQVVRGGRPSATLRARVEHAARLYASGRVRKIIVTGGVGENPPSEAEVMADILRSRGVPDEAILPEKEALSTWDSAWLVADMLHRMGTESVVLVTDPLHCVRAVEAFGEAGVRALAEPAYESPMWYRKWRRTGQLVREAGAIVWYRFHHRMGSRRPPAPGT